ncbi:Inner membrane protein yejM [Pluralibacter gergoviae]|nr:Inner membrane protein yejM [Pluralibacter gergoviae]
MAARPQFSRRITGGGYAIILLALIGSQSIHAWEDANYHRVIPNYSDTFPLYYPLTAKDTLIRWGLVDAAKVDAERRRASKLNHIPDGHFHYPLSAIAAAPPAKPMNILFVMIDAWRFDDAIGAATPHISDFARQSLRFMQHGERRQFHAGGHFQPVLQHPGHLLYVGEKQRPPSGDDAAAGG